MIKFVDESGTFNYCFRTIPMSCTKMHSFLVKGYVCAFLIKKICSP